MSGVDTTHPDYDKIFPDWVVMRDAVAGATTVKGKGVEYLPKPSGFTAMPDGGREAYLAYKLRAQFPEITAPTIRGMVGVIHRVPSRIELPPALGHLRESATPDGLPLEALHRRITQELLTVGRYGLLADMPSVGGNVYLAGYAAEKIINWSHEGDFFVLDETQLERDGFEWVEDAKYRVLEMVDGAYTVELFEGAAESDSTETIVPKATRGNRFKQVPFVVIGSNDVTPDLDEVPLLGVANAAFAAYRLDADYRHQLFNSGQETLVVVGKGIDKVPNIVGSGVSLVYPEGTDVKYVSPSCGGIDRHATAIAAELANAVRAGAKLFDTDRRAAESGDALKIRWAAQTATLTSVAQSSAQGLRNALKNAALFVGADPDSVVVEPNLSFVDSTLPPQEAESLMRLWQGGAISKQTLYSNLQRGEIASHERGFDEEMDLVNAEIDLAPSDDFNTQQ